MQLRELPLTKEDPKNKVKVELSVVDTGKVRSGASWFCNIDANAISGNKSEFFESECCWPRKHCRPLISVLIESIIPSVLAREPVANWYWLGSCHCQQHRIL